MGRNYRGVPVDLEIPERLDHPVYQNLHAGPRHLSLPVFQEDQVFQEPPEIQLLLLVEGSH